MVDRDLVLRKAADIDRYLGELSEFRAIDASAYASDWKIQRIVERTLHLAIEACMDLADHFVADRHEPQLMIGRGLELPAPAGEGPIHVSPRSSRLVEDMA